MKKYYSNGLHINSIFLCMFYTEWWWLSKRVETCSNNINIVIIGDFYFITQYIINLSQKANAIRLCGCEKSEKIISELKTKFVFTTCVLRAQDYEFGLETDLSRGYCGIPQHSRAWIVIVSRYRRQPGLHLFFKIIL